MCDDFRPRLKSADLQKLAAERLAVLQAQGNELRPVTNTSRKLADNFWGSAWMKQLALCESGGMCLAPGRTLLRHGCVLDLQITSCCIRALISAEDLYNVEIRLRPLDDDTLARLSTCCSQHIDSLMSILEGRLDASVLEHLCHPEHGLLPAPADWRMNCTCPDWSEPCPHAAAAIYAAGCMIDTDPQLLFTLRGITPETLLTAPEKTILIDTGKLESMFGIEIDTPDMQHRELDAQPGEW